MLLEISRHKKEDIPEMIEIWNEVVSDGQAFPQEETLTLESGRAFFEAQTYCGVARDKKGAVCGLFILHPNNVGRCGHICNASYAVAKNNRGSGIGRRLVLDSLAAAKAAGFRIIQFNAVVASNEPALALYRELGFRHLGTIEDGFRNKCGAYENIEVFWRKL